MLSLRASESSFASADNASTTFAVVYSVASAATGRSSLRIAALVTGLMLTNCTSPLRMRRRAAGPSRRISASAIFELVSVMQSMWPWLICSSNSRSISAASTCE